jgi:hypothetical protein
MSRSPVSSPPDEQLVRPLPPTEPGGRPGRDAHPGPGAGSAHRPVPAPTGPDAVPVPARRAAHAIVRMALEVVDRRRPPTQTRGAFPPHLTEMLRVLAREGVPGRDLGPARVHRIHINAAGVPAADESADYEVCATYARGPRLFAVAARIQVTATGATCTALRLA